MYPQCMFRAKILKMSFFLVKFSIFAGEKNLCIMHGHAFVMHSGNGKSPPETSYQ